MRMMNGEPSRNDGGCADSAAEPLPSTAAPAAPAPDAAEAEADAEVGGTRTGFGDSMRARPPMNASRMRRAFSIVYTTCAIVSSTWFVSDVCCSKHM